MKPILRRWSQLVPVPSALLFPLLLVFSGCEAAGLTGTQLRTQSTEQLSRSTTRPFRLTLVGNANPDFSQGPCNVVNVESGTGVAQHLGRVTWSANEVANFCVDPGDPNKGLVSGAVVITAANGDQLTATYTTTVQADWVAGQLAAEGDYEISGGTGRFSQASGGGVIAVTGSLGPPFDVAGTFTGVLGY